MRSMKMNIKTNKWNHDQIRWQSYLLSMQPTSSEPTNVLNFFFIGIIKLEKLLEAEHKNTPSIAGVIDWYPQLT